MAITAKLKYLRIAPRKVRLVAALIRGKSIEEAQTTLNFLTKKPAEALLKLLKQAIVSAKNNFQLAENNLYISKITVDEGPKYKRWRARARGRADMIQKKTSHVTLVLDEIKKTAKKAKKVKPKAIEKKIKEEKVRERVVKPEKPKFKPEKEIEKPRVEKGIRRIFRRKAFG